MTEKMKILFTDLDGTLLDANGHISAYTLKILRSFHESGNLIVPASGRPISSILEVVEKAGISDIVDYVIAYNGAVVWDCKNNKAVWEANVPRELAIKIQDYAIANNLHLHTYFDEEIISIADDPEIEFYTRKIHMPVVISPSPVTYKSGDVHKVLIVILSDHDRLCRMRDDLSPEFEGKLTIVFSNPRLLEFFNIEAGKGNALRELCKLLSVDIANSYAAGDEENDISMIEAAGCGIAMLNATDAVKQSADVITEVDNGEDGLAKFIESNILL